jgi:DNA polymerase-3 subunit beta
MRMLDAEFPDYTQVVPRAMDFVIQAKLQELKDVVSRILPFTSEKTSGIQCLFAGNSLTLTGYNPEYGEAQETIEIEGDGDIEIGFNGRFLLETLDSLDGDSVLVGINDASGPVAMIPADKDDHVEIIMPMRI